MNPDSDPQTLTVDEYADPALASLELEHRPARQLMTPQMHDRYEPLVSIVEN